MEKNYKKALLLLIKSIDIMDTLNGIKFDAHGHKDFWANTFIDNSRDLLENIMDSDKDFDKYLMEKHGEDYQWLDDDMPDKFDEWLSEMDTDERYEYFISFLNI